MPILYGNNFSALSAESLGYGKFGSTFVNLHSPWLSRRLGNIEDPDQPDYRDENSTQLLLQAELGYTLMEGTKALREAGVRFTPKMDAEPLDVYRSRLARTILVNKFRDVIRAHSNRIFSQPIGIYGDVNPFLYRFLENITKSGESLHSFAKSLYEDAKIPGLSLVFLDSPARAEDDSFQNQFENRAFFRMIDVEHFLGHDEEIIDGVQVVTGFRYRFFKREKKGRYGHQLIECVRHIQPNVETTYTKSREKSKDGKHIWSKKVVETQLSEVNIFPYYTMKKGLLSAEPPLDNLAQLNLQHWNASSDYWNILHFTQCPILAISGSAAPKNVEVSSATAFHLPPDGDIKYVEPKADSIEQGRKALLHLEEQMEKAASDATTRNTPNITATARVLDELELQSQLEKEAIELQVTLDQAFKRLLTISGYEDYVSDSWSIKVNTDVSGLSSFSEARVQYLDQARKGRQVSQHVYIPDIDRLTYQKRLMDFGVLDRDTDLNSANERLEQEMLDIRNKNREFVKIKEEAKGLSSTSEPSPMQEEENQIEDTQIVTNDQSNSDQP